MQPKGYSYVVVVEYHEDAPYVKVVQATSPEAAANVLMDAMHSTGASVRRITVREVSMSGFNGDIEAKGPHWFFAPRVSLVLLQDPTEED